MKKKKNIFLPKETPKQKFIVVGASGSMGQLIIKKATSEGHMVILAFVGPDDFTDHVHDINGEIIDCTSIKEFDWKYLKNEFKEEKQKPIIIDATHESIVKQNWNKLYKPLGFPVIFMTTGIKKEDIVGNKNNVFIASPNSCFSIVYSLCFFSEIPVGEYTNTDTDKKVYYGITESHQGPDLSNGFIGKKNTSSTAKDADFYLARAGFEKIYFESIRDQWKQKNMGVDQKYLNGHAWHTYRFMSESKESINSLLSYPFGVIISELTYYGLSIAESDVGFMKLTNKDESLTFIWKFDDNNIWFSHNVNGRNPYVDDLFSIHGLGFFVSNIIHQKKAVHNMFDYL